MHNDVLDFVKKGKSVNVEAQLTKVRSINEKSVDLNNISILSSRQPTADKGNLSPKELMVNNASVNDEDDDEEDDDNDELYAHVQEGREDINTKGTTQAGSDGDSIVL